MKLTNSIKVALATIAICPAMTMTAQDMRLPEPARNGGMPINTVMTQRHSVRDFDSTRNIDPQLLGQVLWMTLGVNRPEAGAPKDSKPANRTNPTARNWQEIRAFIFGREGVWEYVPENHSLKMVANGDHRAIVAGTKGFSQEFVLDAPYSVVFVADMERLPQDEHAREMALVDAGIACENLNLAATSLGLATVPRATMDSDAIRSLLKLSPRQLPIMNNPIGYPKR